MLRIFASLMCLWTLAACASTEASGEQSASAQDCFLSAQVTGYNLIDDHNVGLSVGASRDYVLTTTWNARDLDWTHAIALRSSTGRICTGNGLGVEIIGGDPRRTYPISQIARAP
ncbi:MAG: hypothetical protein KF779_12340 [Hyphomonadaceae bacterium]|nr:hypothetical protein [Hyphomonadaceae bacterium]MCA8887131.1 hypothetical protein [Hyphomonadaceae bacterium]